MFDVVNIEPYQKATSVDLTRNGQLTRQAMTAQTRQMLLRSLGWADFTFTYANGGFVVNVSQGDLWKEGAQYRTLAETPVDLVGATPPSDGLFRIVQIVAFANPPKNDAPENREFAVVVTPATANSAAVYQTETRQTNTLNRQIATISKVQGDLAPQPTAPTVAADQCVVATVVLGRSGIVSVTPSSLTQVPNLGDVRDSVIFLDEFVQGQGKRIDTLDKNLAALGARIPQNLSDATIRQLLATVSSLTQQTKLKTGDLSFGIDYALDLSQTDNTYAGYAANVDDGIRFPWVSTKEIPMTLYTPGDPVSKVVSNLLLPAFTEESRLSVEGMDGSLSISNQVNTTLTAVQVSIPRTSVRYGPSFDVCVNSQFWQTGQYDPTTQIFSRGGETFQTSMVYNAAGLFAWHYTFQQMFIDTWTDTRWDYLTTPIGLNGAIRAQTFRAPDFGYITSLDIPFVAVDNTYGVTVMLCETKNDGSPNMNRVLERSDLAANAIVGDSNGAVRTKFNFRPCFVKPGVLYAWVTVTRGNYSIATVKNNKFAEGTSFLTTDAGGYFQGDPTVDFAFTANFARFASPRVEVRLNDVDNANGDVISALKFLYGSILPDGTKIIHMARRSGGDWSVISEVMSGQRPLSALAAGPFSTAPLPASVQQKVVFVGTTTVMPAIDLTQAWVTAMRLGTTRNHISLPINLGTNCNRCEVTVVVAGKFDPAQHTTACNLIVNGATVTPSSTTFTDDPLTPGRRTYVYGFTMPTTNTIRVQLPGTLTSNLVAYHVESRFQRSWLV
jgi:hypothetical protein